MLQVKLRYYAASEDVNEIDYEVSWFPMRDVPVHLLKITLSVKENCYPFSYQVRFSGRD
jgi:hypothetical protein